MTFNFNFNGRIHYFGTSLYGGTLVDLAYTHGYGYRLSYSVWEKRRSLIHHAALLLVVKYIFYS